MRKLLTGMMLGLMSVAAAAPALADDHDWREARDDRRDSRDERRDARDDRRDARDDWRDDRRDDRRDAYRQGYAYRSHGPANWNRQWTPYGSGYDDRLTREWVLRNFADRNRNGRISDKEWRRAQGEFYRLADRNRDGYITRFEYDGAIRMLRNVSYGYGYRR